jgi:predicted ATPase/DNA-binding CsgD family transcriptional regulator
LEGHFVGRQAELALLRAKLDEARSGHPSVVLIEGPPGIGKSALVDRFARASSDVQVLRASGDESESDLTYGLVEQLVRFAGLAESTALASKEGQAAGIEDHITAGARVLDLLGSLQEQGPVVLAVDDAHWADLPSLRALLFGLRRLVADQVLALIVTRDEQSPALPEGLRRLVRDQGATLRLAGLDAEDLRALAEAMRIGMVSSRAAQRLHAHTQGNPLHARALLEELPADTWRSDELPLRSPRSFSMLVLHRAATCSPEAQRLVEAASVLGLRCSLATAARLASVDDPLQALEEATRAGLLQPRDAMLSGRAVTFPHPLVHAAVYHDLGPARRAALHAAAAELAEDEASSLRHRVAAAPTEDARLAADLAALGRREATRQAWAIAATHLVSASRLSPARADRERLLLEAMDYMVVAGDFAQASSYAEVVASFAESPRRPYVLALLALANGRVVEAEGLLQDAWERCDAAADAELAVSVAVQIGIRCLLRARGARAADWARRALALVDTTLGAVPLAARAVTLLATGLAHTGRVQEGLAALDAPHPGIAPTPEPALHQLWSRAWVKAVMTDEVHQARTELANLAAVCRQQGLSSLETLALTYLAWAEYRSGAWDDAILHAELAVSIAQDTDEVWPLPLVHGAAAAPLAGRGDWASAAEHCRVARQVAETFGLETYIAYAAIAQAQYAAARGDHLGVIEATEPLFQLARVEGIDEPAGDWPWQDLRADALVSAGRLEEAAEILEPYEALAAERGRRSWMASAARGRGRLEATRGRQAEAEAAFLDGLGQIEQVSMPFDRALLEFAYGQFLRRLGRRRAAATQLGLAQECFVSLGAQPYIDRCDRELAACGLAPARRRGRDRARLTPQELSVVRLAASGLSNREVAAELVVSVKTVEFHLNHAYRKLAVDSRKELASRLQESRGSPGPDLATCP